jgi:PPP family 3-phenylpropionic acid transporter
MPPIWRAASTYIVFFVAVGAAFPYLPVHYRALGLDLGTIGLLAALSAATQLVAAPAWGGLADLFPRSRLTLPAAAVVAAGGALALALAREPVPVIAAVLVLSVGLAGISPVLDARTIELLGPDRARYGRVRAWGSVSFVVSAALCGPLLDTWGTGALFVVYVPCLVLTALIALSVPRRATTRHASLRRGAYQLIREPRMGRFLVGSLLVWASLSAVNCFYSIQIVALGGGTSLVGVAWVVGALVEIPIMWTFPRLSVRFGAERLLVTGSVIFATRSLLVALAPNAEMLVAVAPLEGAGFGLFFVGGVGFVAARAPAGLAGTAQGVFSATSGLAAIMGTAAAGLIASALSIPGMFAVAGAVGVVAAIVVADAVRGSMPSAAPGPDATPVAVNALPDGQGVGPKLRRERADRDHRDAVGPAVAVPPARDHGERRGRPVP